MESLSTLNTLATAFFAFGAALGGYALSIWITAAFTSPLPETGKLMLMVSPIAAVGAAVCGVVGWYVGRMRSGLWGRIKSESIPLSLVSSAESRPVQDAHTDLRPTSLVRPRPGFVVRQAPRTVSPPSGPSGPKPTS
jgi:hypothetical protein